MATETEIYRTVIENITIECYSFDDVVTEIAKLNDARSIEIKHRDVVNADVPNGVWMIEAKRPQ